MTIAHLVQKTFLASLVGGAVVLSIATSPPPPPSLAATTGERTSLLVPGEQDVVEVAFEVVLDEDAYALDELVSTYLDVQACLRRPGAASCRSDGRDDLPAEVSVEVVKALGEEPIASDETRVGGYSTYAYGEVLSGGETRRKIVLRFAVLDPEVMTGPAEVVWTVNATAEFWSLSEKDEKYLEGLSLRLDEVSTEDYVDGRPHELLGEELTFGQHLGREGGNDGDGLEE